MKGLLREVGIAFLLAVLFVPVEAICLTVYSYYWLKRLVILGRGGDFYP